LRLILTGDDRPMRVCAITADGCVVASGDDAGTLRIWSAATGCLIAASEPAAGGIWSIAIHASGRVLTGGEHGTVRTYATIELAEGKLIGTHSAGIVRHVLWLDGDRAASCSGDGTIAVWSIEDGPPLMWQAHHGQTFALATTVRKNVLISGGADGVLAAWDIVSGHQLASMPVGGRVHAIAAHPTHPVIGCAGAGGTVHIAEIIGLDHLW
jgi:WD40 repeat protein